MHKLMSKLKPAPLQRRKPQKHKSGMTTPEMKALSSICLSFSLFIAPFQMTVAQSATSWSSSSPGDTSQAPPPDNNKRAQR